MELVLKFHTGRTFNTPARTYHEFKSGTPMKEFEDKMSYNTLKILLDITHRYYKKQQEQLENPEYDSDEIYDIRFEATKSGGNFAYAVKKAEEIKQRHLEEQGKTGKITPLGAVENALKDGTTNIDFENAKNIKNAEKIEHKGNKSNEGVTKND